MFQCLNTSKRLFSTFLMQHQDSSNPSNPSESTPLSTEEPEAEEPVIVENYDCVICNQSSPSNADRPMCLVVLLQATSVLAHRRHQTAPSALSLPLCDEDRSSLNKVTTLSA